MSITILLSLVLLISSNAYAQNPIYYVTLPIQPTNQLVWTHDGKYTDGNTVSNLMFRMTIDGVSIDLGAVNKNPASGKYEIPFPALVVGNHIIVMFARNETLESIGSGETQIVIEPAPVIKYAPRPPTEVQFLP